jgi:hypothetical protein
VFYHNYETRHFPKEKLPVDNHVNKHIEIYLLVKEYVDLYEDGRNASEATAKLIKERLNEIAKKLAKEYYVVTEKRTNLIIISFWRRIQGGYL